MRKSTATNKKELLGKIAQKYSLELVLLFGSRAQKKNHRESDFDIAYLSKKDLNLKEESKLIVELAPIFQSENIDLVNLRKAPPLLFYAIAKDCKALYERSPLSFANLRAYSFKKYIETKSLYEEKFKRLEERINQM